MLPDRICRTYSLLHAQCFAIIVSEKWGKNGMIISFFHSDSSISKSTLMLSISFPCVLLSSLLEDGLIAYQLATQRIYYILRVSVRLFGGDTSLSLYMIYIMTRVLKSKTIVIIIEYFSFDDTSFILHILD